MMVALWYGLVGFLLVGFVVQEGRNFGAGMLHWVVARTPQERRQVVAAIGPLWSWHEVWLISFGGSLLLAFPRLMGAAFAGYYLALFLILWCILLRGMALEVGGHIADRMWGQFWDFVLAVASTLLAILFGAAAGNLARGVPLDANGDFSMAFFTDFTPWGKVGLLDWYTVSVALFAAVLLGAHGASYLALRTEGPVRERSGAVSRRLWAAVPVLFLAVSAETWVVRPDLRAHAPANPLAWIGLAAVAVSAGFLLSGLRRRDEARTFAASNGLIASLLATGGAAIFPVMLHSTLAPEDSLDAYAVAASPHSLFLGACWWPVALVLSVCYFLFISRRYAGRVGLPKDGDHGSY